MAEERPSQLDFEEWLSDKELSDQDWSLLANTLENEGLQAANPLFPFPGTASSCLKDSSSTNIATTDVEESCFLLSNVLDELYDNGDDSSDYSNEHFDIGDYTDLNDDSLQCQLHSGPDAEPSSSTPKRSGKKHGWSESRKSKAESKESNKKRTWPTKEEKKIRVWVTDPKCTQSKILAYLPKKAKVPKPLSVYNGTGNMNPFVRPLFAQLVSSKATIDGVSTSTAVRTCFRVGEALQIAMRGKDGAEDMLVELYARVAFSERVGTRQNFQFLDLFHDRPPFLSGCFEYWKRCDLWDTDSRVFLEDRGKGKVARVIGRMKKRDNGMGGTRSVISIILIWESTWEDVEEMRAIICGVGMTG